MRNKTTTNSANALIYARVSSERQSREGNGLESQTQRCEAYAKAHGLEIERVFQDRFTGGGDFNDRPNLSKLLEYVEQRPHRKFVLIIDDLTRLARDTIAHIELRKRLESLNVEVMCLNYKFDNSPEGKFIETIFAARGEYDREQNRRQVMQKMRARLELGYWPFNSSDIPGFQRNDKTARDWVLVRKEPEASVVTEALEGFATGRFQQQVDVARFLERKGFFGKKKRKEVYLSQVNRLLTRIEYAGYVEFLPWEVERRPGKHEGLITIDTYNKIQERLKGQRRIWLREDYSSDFPLRPYVRCAGCKKLYTASWSGGNGGRYPYYRCSHKDCIYGNKSIPKKKIESEFLELLKALRPKKELVDLTKAILNDMYQSKYKEFNRGMDERKKRIEEYGDEIERLMERATKTDSDLMAKRYETKAEQLAGEKAKLEGSAREGGDFEVAFGTALEEVMDILKNPANKWDSEDLEDKRLVIKLIFDGKPAYDKIRGFGTAELSCVIRLFERIGATNSQDVEMAGVEPASENDHLHESTMRSFTQGLSTLVGSEAKAQRAEFQQS